MAAGFTSALRDAILSLEATIFGPGSEEATMKAWGEDFCRKLVRIFCSMFGNNGKRYWLSRDHIGSVLGISKEIPLSETCYKKRVWRMARL